jgi:hypothetical protein
MLNEPDTTKVLKAMTMLEFMAPDMNKSCYLLLKAKRIHVYDGCHGAAMHGGQTCNNFDHVPFVKPNARLRQRVGLISLPADLG